MRCIICRSTERSFNIYTIYGNTSYSVRDNIKEILGENVEDYLNATDSVCRNCMIALENVAELLWSVWQVIQQRNKFSFSFKVKKIWDFLSSTYTNEDVDSFENTNLCRTPTPSNLLALKYSSTYNQSVEDRIALREQNRSRASSTFYVSEASECSEVAGIFRKKRRKKKGHNWTRHKSHAKSPTTSEFSRNSHRPRSVRKDSAIYDSGYSPVRETPVSKSRWQKDDDQSNPNQKRTRSVTKTNQQPEETSLFYCWVDGCRESFHNFKVLDKHHINDHNLLASFPCDECRLRYTNAEFLRMHKKIHDNLPFGCPMCLVEVPNQESLQRHLNEHLQYSVPCKYCDMTFLSVASRDNHAKDAHTGRRERIIHKKTIILQRIDKSPVHTTPVPETKKPEHTSFVALQGEQYKTKNYLDLTEENIRLMNLNVARYDRNCDSNVPNSNAGTEVTDCLDVTEENMRLQNIDFLQKEIFFKGNSFPTLPSSGIEFEVVPLETSQSDSNYDSNVPDTKEGTEVTNCLSVTEENMRLKNINSAHQGNSNSTDPNFDIDFEVVESETETSELMYWAR